MRTAEHFEWTIIPQSTVKSEATPAKPERHIDVALAAIDEMLGETK